MSIKLIQLMIPKMRFLGGFVIPKMAKAVMITAEKAEMAWDDEMLDNIGALT